MLKKERALLIVNPFAGQRKAKSNLFTVIEILSSKYMLTVHLTESADDAFSTTRELHSEFKTIFCCGGDGTLSQVVNGCADPNDPPTIGYIPCGTANDVATTLRLPKNMATCARKIINAEANPHDVGVFCGDRKLVYVASFGAFTKSSYDTPQAAKNAFGQSAYVLSGAMDLMNIKKIPTEIICDGRKFSFEDVAFLSVCNTKSTGGIVKFPDTKVALNDGRFELLVVRYPTNINMLNDIFAAVSMQIFDSNSENVMLMHGSHFEIKTRENIAWTLDGESAGEHTNVTIDCIRSGVKILY
ncbi:MAG: diacylglycerol kinase family lipid kinase [Ruminococcaceae bacterium]|nr:diacylglycerol kinase family lipid kinase [Oscillospiraceae bacterium]